jgi:cytoskeletal protein CcmA (bactofilin family)
MAGEPTPTRQRVELTCPECGHVQLEPALVVSTQCQICRAHFQVIDGKAVARSRPATRLAKPRLDSDPYPDAPPPQPKLAYRGSAKPPPEPHPWLRWLFRPKPQRTLLCFDCGHEFKASSEAQSSQCPRCCCYVSLLDYTIEAPWHRSIQTRGDVTILKSGSVTNSTIQCHNLTVLGQLGCPASCSGDLTIRNHGKIPGSVTCRHLRIERRSRVEFMQPVTATSATINGQARGQINCTGTVTLEKGAVLFGYVRAASIVIKRGAKHNGIFEMAAPTETPESPTPEA